MPQIFTVEMDMEDGKTIQTQIDQRDFAEFEIQSFGHPMGGRVPSTMAIRFAAWHSQVRRGEISITWPKWKFTCIEARIIKAGDSEGNDASDPGKAAQ